MREYIKKIFGSGNNTTTLIISNDEMKGIIKIVKSLKDSGLLLEGVNETIQNAAKEKKGGFLSVLLVILGASLLGNILAGKGAIATSHGEGMNRAGEGIVRVGYSNRSLNSSENKKSQNKNKTYF